MAMPYVARVSYSYNSALEDSGLPGYFLDAYVSRDGEALVDVHEVYSSKEEFFDAITEIVPIIDGTPAPSTQEQQELEGVSCYACVPREEIEGQVR